METGQIVYSLDSMERLGRAAQEQTALRKAIDATAPKPINEIMWQLPTKFGGPLHITCKIKNVSFNEALKIKKRAITIVINSSRESL